MAVVVDHGSEAILVRHALSTAGRSNHSRSRNLYCLRLADSSSRKVLEGRDGDGDGELE